MGSDMGDDVDQRLGVPKGAWLSKTIVQVNNTPRSIPGIYLLILVPQGSVPIDSQALPK